MLELEGTPNGIVPEEISEGCLCLCLCPWVPEEISEGCKRRWDRNRHLQLRHAPWCGGVRVECQSRHQGVQKGTIGEGQGGNKKGWQH